MNKIIFYLSLIPSLLFAKYDYDLTICTVFQNDAKYLPEWIEFHQRQGVQHFYLYNNLSTDNPHQILKSYIDIGLVEIHEWPFTYEKESEWTPIQCGAYMDCIERIRRKSKWCAFLDTDEFLFNPDFRDLRSVLKEYDLHNNIWAHWMFYGTSWIEKIPEGQNITDYLVYRAKEGSCTGKSIVKPKYVASCVNPHFFYMKDGSVGINENRLKRSASHLWDQTYTGNIFRINHYWLRDRDFMFNVKIPRRLKWSDNIDSILQLEELMNEIFDPILYQR